MTAVFQPFPMLAGHRAQAWLHHPAYQRPRHFHPEPELNVVIHGRAQMGVGHLSFEMTAGDVLFLRPGQDHVMSSASADLELIVMALTPELAERCLRADLSASSAPFALPAEMLTSLRDKLSSIREPASAEYHEDVVTSLFRESGPRLKAGHTVARRTYQATRRDPTRSVAALARDLRVDPSDVGRYFRRELGLRFVDFKARLRLMQFVEQVDSGATLTEAALACFGSYSQCHRTFERYLECSPSDYFAGARRSLDARFADGS